MTIPWFPRRDSGPDGWGQAPQPVVDLGLVAIGSGPLASLVAC